MAAPTTTAELLDLVYQSGLTDEARLRAHVGNLIATGSLPLDALHLAAALVHDGFLTNLQAEQLLFGKWKGFRIGTYVMLEKIGAGKSCAFYLCEHPKLHRVVAIKVLAPALAELPGSLDQLHREARALTLCQHPNIGGAHDLTRDGKLHFLVTEYIDGTNLLDVVRRGPLDPVRAAHYVAQAAHGLQHVHDHGLVHRNVKPGKLMLERSGVIKLCGMSVVLFRHDTQNLDETIRGTPNYIAPEQSIDSSDVDHRSDIYSLGCTFYHLLTGQVPFPEGSVAQKMIWHQTCEPRPLRALQPAVPEEMARVVEQMMSKTPDSRYQSAAEVAAALSPWCQIAVPPPSAEELPSHCPRVREAIARSSPTQPGAS